ncbi:hypothetical protein F5Y17DRAFT_301149 [Xylariaceae sp. FL0594]|nr:hypothetical protein F5Y17DRAFT_301149 [Xylariaceae sp. FL0594]
MGNGTDRARPPSRSKNGWRRPWHTSVVNARPAQITSNEETWQVVQDSASPENSDLNHLSHNEASDHGSPALDDNFNYLFGSSPLSLSEFGSPSSTSGDADAFDDVQEVSPTPGSHSSNAEDDDNSPVTLTQPPMASAAAAAVAPITTHENPSTFIEISSSSDTSSPYHTANEEHVANQPRSQTKSNTDDDNNNNNSSKKEVIMISDDDVIDNMPMNTAINLKRKFIIGKQPPVKCKRIKIVRKENWASLDMKRRAKTPPEFQGDTYFIVKKKEEKQEKEDKMQADAGTQLDDNNNNAYDMVHRPVSSSSSSSSCSKQPAVAQNGRAASQGGGVVANGASSSSSSSVAPRKSHITSLPRPNLLAAAQTIAFARNRAAAPAAAAAQKQKETVSSSSSSSGYRTLLPAPATQSMNTRPASASASASRDVVAVEEGQEDSARNWLNSYYPNIKYFEACAREDEEQAREAQRKGGFQYRYDYYGNAHASTSQSQPSALRHDDNAQASTSRSSLPGQDDSRRVNTPAAPKASQVDKGKGKLPEVVSDKGKDKAPQVMSEKAKGTLPQVMSEKAKGKLPQVMSEKAKGKLPQVKVSLPARPKAAATQQQQKAPAQEHQPSSDPVLTSPSSPQQMQTSPTCPSDAEEDAGPVLGNFIVDGDYMNKIGQKEREKSDAEKLHDQVQEWKRRRYPSPARAQEEEKVDQNLKWRYVVRGVLFANSELTLDTEDKAALHKLSVCVRTFADRVKANEYLDHYTSPGKMDGLDRFVSRTMELVGPERLLRVDLLLDDDHRHIGWVQRERVPVVLTEVKANERRTKLWQPAMRPPFRHYTITCDMLTYGFDMSALKGLVSFSEDQEGEEKTSSEEEGDKHKHKPKKKVENHGVLADFLASSSDDDVISLSTSSSCDSEEEEQDPFHGHGTPTQRLVWSTTLHVTRTESLTFTHRETANEWAGQEFLKRTIVPEESGLREPCDVAWWQNNAEPEHKRATRRARAGEDGGLFSVRLKTYDMCDRLGYDEIIVRVNEVPDVVGPLNF